MSKIGKIVRKRWRKLTEPLRNLRYEVLRILVIHRRVDAVIRRIDDIEGRFEMHERETRSLHRAIQQPSSDLWLRKPPVIVGGPADMAFNNSTFCRENDFRQPYFSYWSLRIGTIPRFHRKLCEFVFVCQGLWERGVLAPGHRGLGFGVGEEALPALFAAHGCDVVATDLAPEGATAIGWIETAQHARERDGLRRPDICPDEIFDQRVSFEPCDMNAIPEHLRDFDFCWSSCAFEHLGSIERGLEFVENSLACLKPGGWALHTTEYNILSDRETVDQGGTVLFRRRDFEALARRLTAKGHTVAPLCFEPGDGLIDGYIDVAPFSDDISLNIAMFGYATTSFGFAVQRGPAERNVTQFAETLRDDRTQVTAWLLSHNPDERRHAALVIGAWLRMIDVDVQSLQQALMDAILVENEPELLELELRSLLEAPSLLGSIHGWQALLHRLPMLGFDAACHALDLLKRNNDPSHAALLYAVDCPPGFPNERRARTIASLRRQYLRGTHIIA